MGEPHGSPITGLLSRSGFHRFVQAGSALLALAAMASAALGQSVKDLAEVEGARANKLHGYGLVTGLGGTGDSPRDESARLLRAMLQNLVSPDASVQKIEGRNAAIVLVTAELRPFQKQGTRMDVSVSAVGDAKSLAGGELQMTDLRGPQGRRGPIYALASGRLVVQGEAKRGHLTAAAIPGGAIVERELEHRFVADVVVPGSGGEVRRKGFKLVLRKPDFTTASQIAGQINASAVTGSGGRLDVAASLDGGSVLVRIPTAEEYRDVTGSVPEVDYEREPVRWLDFILNRPIVFSSPETASVVLNDVTKSVSWTGDVRLREGSVMVSVPGAKPSVFHAREGQRLSEFMEKAGPALGDQQIIDLVRALDQAGLVKAEVRTH
jgi:flagellar P-ring protein precursor FlgI